MDLVQERRETIERELAALQLSNEARRLNPSPRGPFAALMRRFRKVAQARDRDV